MKKIFMAALAVAALVACDKLVKRTTTSGGVAVNKSKFIGKYKITGADFVPKLYPISTSVYNIYFKDSCKKDDTHEFAENNVYTFTDTDSVCNPAQKTLVASYEFNSTNLTYNGAAFTFKSFDTTQMPYVLKIEKDTMGVSNGISVEGKVILTFTKRN